VLSASCIAHSSFHLCHDAFSPADPAAPISHLTSTDSALTRPQTNHTSPTDVVGPTHSLPHVVLLSYAMSVSADPQVAKTRRHLTNALLSCPTCPLIMWIDRRLPSYALKNAALNLTPVTRAGAFRSGFFDPTHAGMSAVEAGPGSRHAWVAIGAANCCAGQPSSTPLTTDT
jgi:hypothetical protein